MESNSEIKGLQGASASEIAMYLYVKTAKMGVCVFPV